MVIEDGKYSLISRRKCYVLQKHSCRCAGVQ